MAYSLFCGLAPLSLCLFVTGDVFTGYETMLAGIVCLFAANLIYGFLDLRNHLLFLFLHFGFALFLLSRPLVCVFSDYPLYSWINPNPETMHFMLLAMYLSLACLLLGTLFCSALVAHNERVRASQAASKLPVVENATAAAVPATDDSERPLKLNKQQKIEIIRWVSLFCFFVCFAFALYDGYLRVSYMSGRAYTEYYLTAASEYVPWSVNFLKVMAPYMMCGFLATMPRRRISTIVLLMNICIEAPMLLVGARASFVIAVLFAAFYYIFRGLTDKKQVWITPRLVIACLIILPVGIAALGLLGLTRSNKETAGYGFIGMVVDALYKQGVSFSVLGFGYNVNPHIQDLGFRFYSIGRVSDYITQGFIGQTFLGCTLLPSTNSVELATQGYSYAHAMSYFAHPNYLGGEGYGSSYILELFADFGYAGIAGGSFAIACGLFALSRSLGRSWFWGTVALVSSFNVVHMPRGYADEWFSFIISTRFLVAIIGVAFLSAIVALLKYTVIPRLRERTHRAPKGEHLVAGGNAQGLRVLASEQALSVLLPPYCRGRQEEAAAAVCAGDGARSAGMALNKFGIAVVEQPIIRQKR